jgi:hypothetical protein
MPCLAHEHQRRILDETHYLLEDSGEMSQEAFLKWELPS